MLKSEILKRVKTLIDLADELEREKVIYPSDARQLRGNARAIRDNISFLGE